jgi:predicted PurR-regulated permease PerM
LIAEQPIQKGICVPNQQDQLIGLEAPRAGEPDDHASGEAFPGSRIARIACVIGVIAVAVWVLWSFIPALIWAGTIATATWPIRERLIRAGLKPLSSAILLTGVWALLLVLPIILFGTALAREASAVRELAEQAAQGRLEAPDWLARLPGVGQYLTGWWHAHLTTPGKSVVGSSQTASALGYGRDVGRFVVRRVTILGFTLLALLVLYKDGSRLGADAERIGARLFGTDAARYGRFSVNAVRATVNGLVLVGLGEGFLLGLAYAICGVPHPITFAVGTALLAIVPFGAPVVLAAASLTLIFGSRLVTGIAMLGIGLIVIFIIDHTARPALIGGSIRLPFFWALLGVFGGLEAFGLVGLFLGPAILAVALAIWRDAARPTLVPG